MREPSLPYAWPARALSPSAWWREGMEEILCLAQPVVPTAGRTSVQASAWEDDKEATNYLICYLKVSLIIYTQCTYVIEEFPHTLFILQKPDGLHTMDLDEEIIDLFKQEAENEFGPAPLPSNPKPSRQHIDGHLASPIYRDEVDLLLDPRFQPMCDRHRFWVTLLSEYDKVENFSVEGTKLIPLIQERIRAQRVDLSALKVSVAAAAKTTLLQLRTVMRPSLGGCLVTGSELESLVKQLESRMGEMPPELMAAYADMRAAEVFKDGYCATEFKHGDTITHQGFTGDGDLTLMARGQVPILMPTSYLLMVLDKMQARFPLLLYWWLTDGVPFYPNLSIFQTGNRLIQTFEGLRYKMGELFFSFISAWESLLRGAILKLDPNSEGLYESTLAEMIELLRKASVEFSPKDVCPDDSEGEITAVECTMWLELTGITKIFGYPTLKGNELLQPLREFGVEDQGNYDSELAQEVLAYIMRDFYKEYYKKEGVPLLLRSGSEALMKLQQKPRQMMRAPLTDWVGARFAKAFEFNQHPDELELIKDSACSVPMSHWSSQYDPCAFHFYHNKKKPRTIGQVPTRRVITHFLESDGSTLKDALQERDRGYISPDDHIATLNGKERELKIGSGRAFTKQTPKQRLVQTALESNIADQIFRYVPAQSMTASDLTNSQNIQSHVTPRAGFIRLTINLDLKKWCLHQRNYNTCGIGKMYDDLFGTNALFSASHGYFVGCNVFNGHRLCPPDYNAATGLPEPGPNYMNDFVGGFEGLHQKKWTHFSVGVIGVVRERLYKTRGIQSVNMGQGDNQIIVLDVPDSQDYDIAEIKRNFLSDLTKAFDSVGHVLKDKETWASVSMHEYSKGLIYKGVSVCAGTKKASNIIPDVNDGLSTYVTAISSINTSTEGIARVYPSPVLPFFMNQILVSEYLSRKKLVGNSVGLKCAALTFPADVGGLPLSTLYSHAIRGVTDHLTYWIAVLLEADLAFPTVAASMRRIWDLGKNTNTDDPSCRSRLLDDIYCIRATPLPSITQLVKEAGKRYLHSPRIRHPLVVQLRDTSQVLTREAILDLTRGMKEYPAGLMSLLVANSNAGLLEGMLGKVTRNKTVESFTNWDGGLSDKIKEAETEWARELDRRLLRRNHTMRNRELLTGPCPTAIAERIRMFNYGCLIVNATRPPHSHQVVMCDPDVSPPSLMDRTIIINTSPAAQMSEAAIRHRRGEYKAYIGGSTAAKIRKQVTTDQAAKTSLGRAFSKLTMIRSYLVRLDTPKMIALVDCLLNEKRGTMTVLRDTSREDELSMETLSGNPFHRLFSASERPYALLNAPPAVGTHFTQTTNSMVTMTEQGEDYNIFFQRDFICNVVNLIILSSIQGALKSQYTATYYCLACTRRVDNYDIDLVAEGSPEIPLQVLPVVGGSLAPPIQPVTELLLLQEMAGIIADNVDENYTRYHLQRGHTIPHVTKVAGVSGVSGNDLRCLSLLTILRMATHRSWYLYSLATGPSVSLAAGGLHLALGGVAELVLKMGILDQLTNQSQVALSEHAEGCTTDGMTKYIARVVSTTCWESDLEVRRRAWSILPRDWRQKKVLAVSALAWLRSVGGRSDPVSAKLLEALAGRADGEQVDLSDIILAGWHPSLSHVASADILSVWKGATARRFIPIRVTVDTARYRQTRFPIGFVIQAYAVIYGTCELRFFESKAIPYIGRPVGHISTAGSKYIEVLNLIMALDQAYRRILCLADGSGSVTTILGQQFPDAELMYNTLLVAGVDERYDATYQRPPASYGHLTSSRFKHLSTTMMGTTNILTPEFVSKLLITLKGEPVDLLTMDAESSAELGTNKEFFDLWVPLLPILGCQTGIFKMFWSPTFIREEWDAVVPEGYSLTIIKPPSSNPTSTEMFAVVTRSKVADQAITLENLTFECCPAFWRVAAQSKALMTTQGINTYADLLKRTRHHLRAITPAASRIESRPLRINTDQACSAHCAFAAIEIWKVIDQLILFKHEAQGDMGTLPMGALALMRSTDKNKAIIGYLKQVLAIGLMGSQDNSASEVLKLLASHYVPSNPSRNWMKRPGKIFKGRGSVMERVLDSDIQFHDAKFLVSQRLIKGPCNCRPTRRIGLGSQVCRTLVLKWARICATRVGRVVSAQLKLSLPTAAQPDYKWRGARPRPKKARGGRNHPRGPRK